MAGSTEETVWRMNELADLHWRRWSDEWTVFDVGSGQTHQMDMLTAVTVMMLQDGPADPQALMKRVSDELIIDSTVELSSTLGDILNRLSAVGLIEPAP